MAKVRMPKNRQEFEEQLINAFHAGCNAGYAVEHNDGVYEQEHAEALHYIGRITEDELAEVLCKYRGCGKVHNIQRFMIEPLNDLFIQSK